MNKNTMKYPRWLNLVENGELFDRAARAAELAAACELCPRCCKAKRGKGARGACGALEPFMANVAAVHAHHGEEPPISGTRGSGTVFFAGCNLHCAFCQNYQISNIGPDSSYSTLSPDELADKFLHLEATGCHNLNLVTPSPYLPSILSALEIAARRDFRLPIVYNCGGYESIESLKLLDGVVDVYLPDMKFGAPGPDRLLTEVSNYVEINRAALKEMYNQVGGLVLDDNGVALFGLLIRHLVLPGGMSATEEALEFVARELSPEVHVSLMSQYYPAYKAGNYKEISRPLQFLEYEEAKRALERLGIENGWIQELDSNLVFRPDFEKDVPFDN